MLRLTVINGPFPGQSQSFPGSEITIGRGGDNHCVLRDTAVSKHHGRITRLKHGYVYRDLGSRHGSVVGYLDQLVRLDGRDAEGTCFLSHGARLQVGETIMLVDLDFRDVPLSKVAPEIPGKLDLSKLREGPSVSSFVRSLMGDPVETEESIWRRETAMEETDRLLMGASDCAVTASDPEILAAPQTEAASAFYRKAETMIGHDPQAKVSRQADEDFSRQRVILGLLRHAVGSNSETQDLHHVVQATYSLYPLAHCLTIHLYQDNGELAPFLTRFSSEDRTTDLASVICLPLIEKVAKTGELIRYTRGGDHGPLPLVFAEGGVWSGLYAPLPGREGVIGVFSLTSQNSSQLFLPEDLELFEHLSASVALIVERSILAKTLSAMFPAFVRASVHTIETRDPPSAGHASRVSSYCLALAATVNDTREGLFGSFHFPDPELQALHYAALLHDFGKVTVSDVLLKKRVRLSDKDMRCIKERFARIKEQHRRVLLEELSLEFHRAGRCPGPVDLDELETDSSFLSARLDSICHFVESVRHQFRLDAATMEKIKSLHTAHVVFGNERIDLFEDQELEELAGQDDSNLTPNQLAEIRQHLAGTLKFLRLVPWMGRLRLVPEIVAAFYRRLRGEEPEEAERNSSTELLASIVHLAHVFDAWTARDRPYRQALSIPDALGKLAESAKAGRLSAPLLQLFQDEIVPRLNRSRAWRTRATTHLPDLNHPG